MNERTPLSERTADIGWACPMPYRDHERVQLGHGGGGTMSQELVGGVILPSFGTPADAELLDAATLEVGSARLAFSTDSYVVRPLFFPGGCIGDLAVNGTINDLAMRGARPLALSVGLIIEEGLEMDTLVRVVTSMGDAARVAGVELATGDTKVVDAGHGDGLFINTSGIGEIAPGIDIRPRRATPGDHVLVSGPIGAHGIAVMSQREGLEFGTEVRTDSAPLHGLVAAMLASGADLHVLRDPTRGGLATSLHEIALEARVGIDYEEAAVPVADEVAAACALLGLDPVNIANEGVLVAIVGADDVDDLLAVMRSHEHGCGARDIGSVTKEHPGLVVAETPIGGRRIVDPPMGEQLPRIC